MSINIKPSHEGLLHKDLGKKKGTKLSVASEEKAKHSSDPAERKRATFALNARKWNHSGAKKKPAGKKEHRVTYKYHN